MARRSVLKDIGIVVLRHGQQCATCAGTVRLRIEFALCEIDQNSIDVELRDVDEFEPEGYWGDQK